MSYHLFLDDERKASDATWVDLPLADWVTVRNFTEFSSTLRTKGMPAFVSFDHDLAPEHYGADFSTIACYAKLKNKTGFDCAVHLVDVCGENRLPPPAYVCHTLNRDGARHITTLLEGYRKFQTQRLEQS